MRSGWHATAPGPEDEATPALDRDSIRRLVVDERVAVLATADADGRPHLVPVTFAIDGDALYSVVDHKPKTTQRLRRIANIRRDGRVTVLVHSYDEDWDRLWWCRLRGDARVIETGPQLDLARGFLVRKYEQYRETPPSGSAIVISITDWAGWSAK